MHVRNGWAKKALDGHGTGILLQHKAMAAVFASVLAMMRASLGRTKIMKRTLKLKAHGCMAFACQGTIPSCPCTVGAAALILFADSTVQVEAFSAVDTKRTLAVVSCGPSSLRDMHATVLRQDNQQI